MRAGGEPKSAPALRFRIDERSPIFLFGGVAVVSALVRAAVRLTLGDHARFTGVSSPAPPSSAPAISDSSTSVAADDPAPDPPPPPVRAAAASAAASSSATCWRSIREHVEYHRFLTPLSERPGSDLAISAHRVPSFLCSRRIVRSSSCVQSPFLSVGSRLLHHRSRHCFPVRPGIIVAIRAHCFPP